MRAFIVCDHPESPNGEVGTDLQEEHLIFNDKLVSVKELEEER